MGVYEAIECSEQHEQQASSCEGSEIISAAYLEFRIRVDGIRMIDEKKKIT